MGSDHGVWLKPFVLMPPLEVSPKAAHYLLIIVWRMWTQIKLAATPGGQLPSKVDPNRELGYKERIKGGVPQRWGAPTFSGWPEGGMTKP